MQRDIDELLLDVVEMETVLAKSKAREGLTQVSFVAQSIAESAPTDTIAKLAGALARKADSLVRAKTAGNGSIELMKDAAFRLRISLLALKRGGSPLE